MKTIPHTRVVIGLIAAGCMFAAGGARAGATIFNNLGAPSSVIALGVNDFGHLNTVTGAVSVNSGSGGPLDPLVTGLAYKFADGQFRDAISPAADSEGWGVSTSSNGGHSGFANVTTDGGAVNLTLGSFIAGGSTAISVVSLTTLPGLSVRHAYTPAAGAPSELFQSLVTITNTTGTALNDVKYVRVVDWDVPPTEFNEFVTIRGTATTTMLERSHNGGFSSANPLGPEALFDPATVNVDFTDFGPADQGAYFRFNFGTLAAGGEIQFSVFYGASPSEQRALSALAADGIELFSLGQSSLPDGDPTLGTPVTYILGFRDVGNAAEPPQVPTPATLALLGLGLAGLGWSRRRK
jgi:type IV pilus assembly protein PilY1